MMDDCLSLLGLAEYDQVNFFFVFNRPADISTSVDGFTGFLKQIRQQDRGRVFLFFTNPLFKVPETVTVSVAAVLADIPRAPVTSVDLNDPVSIVYHSIYEDTDIPVRRFFQIRSEFTIDPWLYYRILPVIWNIQVFCLIPLNGDGLKIVDAPPIRPNMNPYDDAADEDDEEGGDDENGGDDEQGGDDENGGDGENEGDNDEQGGDDDEPAPGPWVPPPAENDEENEPPLFENWDLPSQLGSSSEENGDSGEESEHVEQEDQALEIESQLGKLFNVDRSSLAKILKNEKPLSDAMQEFDLEGGPDEIRYGFKFVSIII